MLETILTYLNTSAGQPIQAGTAFFTARGGKLVSTTFQYETSYLAAKESFFLDPELQLVTGGQNVSGLPGAFQDCSPDRWGRNLITKARRAQAKAEDRRLETLTEVDFLAGASDVTRQGALRFRAVQGGPFLRDDTEVPKLLELPRLLRAADAVSRDDDFAAIKELLAAGTGSLGGARPKASVRGGSTLYIAKFPHPDDDWDVMAWEKTALDLAEAAGIRVPVSRLTEVGGRHVLLLERFDRRGSTRIHYLSAMTLLSARDGDSHDYWEIAEALPEVSSATRADLNELWRRIAFSIVINNTDDHLRNHGLVHEAGAWRLSPAFDLNPNPDAATARATGVGGEHHRAEALEALLANVKDFDLDQHRATEILQEVTEAVSRWREVAGSHGVSTSEFHLFEDAFWQPDT